MRLVATSPTPLPRSTELDALLHAVKRFAPRPGDVLPADPQLLAVLFAAAGMWPSAPPSAEAIAGLVQRALATGALRRVVIGSEPHLAWPSQESLPAPPPDTAPPDEEPHDDAAPPPDRVDPNAPTPVREAIAPGAFDDQVAVDLEHERVLLYRVALVVEGIVALIALRGLVLGFLGL